MRTEIACEVCNKPIPPRNTRFCSLQCSIQKPTNYWVGKKFSSQYRQKLSQAHKGKMVGEAHPNWKGADAGYISKHLWVARQLGKPTKCSECGTLTAKKYEWANISGEYKRDLSDWVRLCTKCHHALDRISERGWATRRARNADIG